MSTIRIPTDIFDATSQALEIPSKVVNQVIEEEIYDDFNQYQNAYQVFGFMTIRNGNIVRRTTIHGDVPMWQPHKGCKATPMGGLDMFEEDFETCKARLFAKWCPYDVFDSCFEGLLQWDAQGRITEDNTMQRLVAKIVSVFGRAAHRSALNLAMLGSFFDFDAVDLSEGPNDELIKNFQIEHNTCKGLLYRIKQKSAKYAHLIVDCFPKEDFFDKDCNINLEITDLFDCLKCEAHPDLQAVINKGAAISADGRPLSPLFVLSDNLIALVNQQVKEVSTQFTQNAYATGKGLMCPIEMVRQPNGTIQYYVYGVPVIPLSVFCGYNKYLAGEFYFAALTVSNNMQILTNYGSNLGNLGNQGNIGMAVERETSIKNGDYGSYTFDASMILTSGLANWNLFTGAYAYYQD